MRMTLDFSDARMTACHCYVGVRARIDEGPETIVTIGPDGSYIGGTAKTTLPCEKPEIDTIQAASVAMLLTKGAQHEPRNGIWDAERLRITFPLGRTRRLMMI